MTELAKRLEKLAAEIGHSNPVTDEQKQQLIGMIDILLIELERIENRLQAMIDKL